MNFSLKNFSFKREPRIKRTVEEQRRYIFTELPVWKSVWKMALPSMFTSFVLGAYTFCDSILAVYFAADSYSDYGSVQAHELVRMFMSGAAPIAALMTSITLLLGIGVSTRVSINVGKGDMDRARRTLRTGMMTSTIMSVALIPVLWFAAKPWMQSQYPSDVAVYMSDHAFQFVWPLIVGFPLQSFSQTAALMFRVEGRNREMVMASLFPTLLNLLLDWTFMGPGGLNIAGGAWATVTANGVSTIMVIFFIYRMKSNIVTFRNMFGKFSALPLIGIMLVGVAPFFNQFAQATTATAEASIIASVSGYVYGTAKDGLAMTNVMSGSLLIVLLFFPIVLAFNQASRPIASFNYGAGNIDRVKATVWWTLIYAVGSAIFVYFIGAWALSSPLLDALGVRDSSDFATKTKSVWALRIMMITMPLFTVAVTGQTMFGSTDRVTFSIIASMLRGFIYIFPVVYMFKAIAIASSWEYAFWFFYPFLGLVSSITVSIMMVITWRNLAKRPVTLDQRIDKWNLYFINRKKERIARRAI